MRILLGVTGGIAAYKAANLIRALSEQGHEVTVLPTENALKFVGKVTLEALSGHAIDTDLYSDVAQVRHVELGAQADLILVAPATANFLAKLAGGMADDLLMNAILASTAPVFVCPAMHTEMWQNPATAANVATLRSRGISVMQPASGRLTGQDSGPGRLPEVDQILEFVLGHGPLSGKTVLVTAGGTRESIDEVRFIGNASSGRMGIELAKAARDLGGQVTLVGANLEIPPPHGVTFVPVASASDLELAMNQACDLLIMAAAVSDFTVESPFLGKLPRSQAVTLSLTPTKDLVANYASNHPKTFCVAFALSPEGGNAELLASEKLWSKSVQAVVGNSVQALGSDVTEVSFVTPNGVEAVSGTKQSVSRELLRLIIESMSKR